tara:strand:+ start:1534 stop:1650 length:117 start_codon:yes stop_codon:yes gene_type:complete
MSSDSTSDGEFSSDEEVDQSKQRPKIGFGQQVLGDEKL